MRARLLIAFFGIAGFAVLAAAAAIYAFREVGERLDVVDTRVPPTLSALELSRSAERIIAAAPALLAAPDRTRRDEVKAELAAEVERLNGGLRDLEEAGARALPLDEVAPLVSALTARLDALDGLVAHRLATSERITALRREVFGTSAEVQRLLAPWLKVMEGEIAALVGEVRDAPADDPGDRGRRLAARIELQRLTQTAQRQASAAVDMLAEASTSEEAERLSILEFQLGLALRDLEATAAGLDPRLRPLFLEQVARLRQFAEGPNSIVDARRRELALVRDGERLLAETGGLSARLTSAVDALGGAARREVGAAIRDALSVQRLSTRALVVVVALSLVTSVLIVWLYVGRSIVRRLGALGEGILAIAGGRLHVPVAVEGADEIAAMARAVEVFRHNAIELEQLLEERKRTAERLEQMVGERTRELTESLEQQQAASEILRIIASSPNDLQPVFDTTAESVARLCSVRFCQVFRFDGELIHFASHHGLTPEAVDDIRHAYPMPPGRASAVARAILTGSVAQIPDVRADFDYARGRFAEIMSFRSVAAVPMLKDGRPIGAIAMARSQPGHFPERQIELLRTFADQAVIAIENVRMFDEIQDKSRQLEIANRYKSHFLASASHDLRQPLHALNLFVAQLNAEPDSAERGRLVERVDAAVGSMNELFESLLDMSKLEAGIVEPQLAEFPIERVLQRIETTFADAAGQKGLRLSVVPSRAWVRSDLVLLERIVMNLVSNAVRYTPRGGVVIGCRRRGGRLRIDVCDSGPGIAEEQQRSIFDEYHRLDAAGADRSGGLGLGLAIVDRLGRLLDHEVEVESRPGRGSRFSVSVPLSAERRGVAAIPPSPGIADPVRGRLVVVVDDDPLVLEGMGGILRSWGCRVVAARSEQSALAGVTAEGRLPDLVISDYRLANGTTGIQAIERLRRELGAAIPAFLISGDTAPERLRDARAHGIHLLHKPVSPMQLRAMLSRLLKSGPAERMAAPAAE